MHVYWVQHCDQISEPPPGITLLSKTPLYSGIPQLVYCIVGIAREHQNVPKVNLIIGEFTVALPANGYRDTLNLGGSFRIRVKAAGNHVIAFPAWRGVAAISTSSRHRPREISAEVATSQPDDIVYQSAEPSTPAAARPSQDEKTVGPEEAAK